MAAAATRVRRILVLGGTGEARELAARLTRHPGVAVVTSLAGRVSDPALPEGEVRIGGFGGADGLEAWLRDHDVDLLIDATHPFASVITRNAATAAMAAGVPSIILHRPGWVATNADRWHRVAGFAHAARYVATVHRGGRVFLTIGRQHVGQFAGDAQSAYLVRCIEPPDSLPPRHRVLYDRGPFTLDAERTLLLEERIDVLVTKDSGGGATAAKLLAARELGLPVVVVDRPPLPDGVPVVGTAAEAEALAFPVSA